MGIFSKKVKVCFVCGKGINPVSTTYSSSDKKTICVDCVELLGLPNIPSTKKKVSRLSSEEISGGFQKANKIPFDATVKPSTLVHFDDVNKLIKANFSIHGGTPNEVLDYSSLIDFSIQEDGETVLSSGVGTALAGGVLFGTKGAILGAIVGKGRVKKRTINSLILKIKTNDGELKKIYFLSDPIKLDSSHYRSIRTSFEATVSKLDAVIKIYSSNDSYLHFTEQSKSDELSEFKELLDDGIITQDEFNLKKDALLR